MQLILQRLSSILQSVEV